MKLQKKILKIMEAEYGNDVGGILFSIMAFFLYANNVFSTPMLFIIILGIWVARLFCTVMRIREINKLFINLGDSKWNAHI